jgi:hypothetical protein
MINGQFGIVFSGDFRHVSSCKFNLFERKVSHAEQVIRIADGMLANREVEWPFRREAMHRQKKWWRASAFA